MRPEKRFLNKLMLLCLIFPYCTCTDTLTPAQSITDEDQLVSSGQKFALGFFSPGNSSHRYIGIWYHKIPEQPVIWVANRDHPIRENSSGVLTINSDGNLVILDGITNSTVWSSNASMFPRNNNTIAKLLDSGNLVLTHKDSKNILWQSFDYPTHTSVPDMKNGINRRLGLNWTLTPWKSEDDPGRGNYTIMLDPRGSPQFFLYKGTDRLWRSGPWNGRGLSANPEFVLPNFVDTAFVNTQDEISWTHGVTNSSIFTRVVLSVSGLTQRLAWIEESHQWTKFWTLPRDDCDNYGRCGPYGVCNDNNPTDCSCLPGFEPKSPQEWYWGYYSGGCIRKRAAQSCGKGDGFLKTSNVKVPDTSVARVDKSLNVEECKQECLRNCNCTAYTAADIRGDGSGCLAWHGVLMDTKEFISGEQDLFVRVDAVELAANARKDSKGNRGNRRTLTILSVSLVLGLFLLVSCGFYLAKRIRKRKEKLGETTTNTELPLYDLRTIIAATDNFSATNKLGEGGFGPVHWGRLFDGQEIAVKRLSKSSRQGVEELKNEIVLIAKLQHRNLVRILGCCFHKEEKMLIYEYLPNKSLDSFIFDESRRVLLDWDKRFRIIVGIARGVMYLHQDSRLRIIHRDLKASNVLLDADMNPKISDFGIAKIFWGDRSQANTKRVVGTYGYMSPEYVMKGLFSEKSDVFSFGVLLLEIISGKKNSDYYLEDPSTILIGHVWELWNEGSALDIVDASLCGSCSAAQEVLRCIQIGLLCVQDSPSDRPTMSTVVFMLGNETKLPLPRQPAFVASKIGIIPNSCTTRIGAGAPASINDVTITMFQAR